MNLKIVFLIFFSLLFISNTNCQDSIPPQLEFGINAGIQSYQISDKLLNDQLYEGVTLKSFDLFCRLESGKNNHYLKAGRNEARLDNEVPYYYYNYISYWILYLRYDYSRVIFNYRNALKLSTGLSYKGHLTNIDQHYQNDLYYYGRGIKESYDVSVMQLMLNLNLQYKFRRHAITGTYVSSLFNYGARPDDFFVRYPHSGFDLKLFSFDEFYSWQGTVNYQYELSKKLRLSARGNIIKLRYHGISELKIIERELFIGLAFVL